MGIVLIHAEGKSIHTYYDGNVGSGLGGRQAEVQQCKQKGYKVKRLAYKTGEWQQWMWEPSLEPQVVTATALERRLDRWRGGWLVSCLWKTQIEKQSSQLGRSQWKRGASKTWKSLTWAGEPRGASRWRGPDLGDSAPRSPPPWDLPMTQSPPCWPLPAALSAQWTSWFLAFVLFSSNVLLTTLNTPRG